MCTCPVALNKQFQVLTSVIKTVISQHEWELGLYTTNIPVIGELLERLTDGSSYSVWAAANTCCLSLASLWCSLANVCRTYKCRVHYILCVLGTWLFLPLACLFSHTLLRGVYWMASDLMDSLLRNPVTLVCFVAPPGRCDVLTHQLHERGCMRASLRWYWTLFWSEQVKFCVSSESSQSVSKLLLYKSQ